MPAVKEHYLESLKLVERLHRRLLDVIKDEFDRRGPLDVNSVQALLLYNFGDKELTAGELRTRGYYLARTSSYNVKKLVEMGYLHHARSRVDRRSVRISLTEKGQQVHDIVSGLYEKHIKRSRTSAASRPTISSASTPRCCAWNASGRIRSASGCKSALRNQINREAGLRPAFFAWAGGGAGARLPFGIAGRPARCASSIVGTPKA